MRVEQKSTHKNPEGGHMKKVLLTAIGLILALSVGVKAQWNDNISFHFEDYALIPSANATNLNGGIQAGRAYACFVVTNLPSLTEAQAAVSGGSSSTKQLVFSLLSHIVDDYNALASTNRTTKMIPSETVQGGSGANVTINHGIQSIKSIDAGTVVSE
jgi:opacity protein-like surface antigen